MEINVVNNEIFTKLQLKIRVRGKDIFQQNENHMKEQTIDNNKCEYLPDKQNPMIMKTCFSEGKLIKQFGNPPLSKRTLPPFQPTSLYLSNFFMTPLFVQSSKTRIPPTNFRGWQETMDYRQLQIIVAHRTRYSNM